MLIKMWRVEPYRYALLWICLLFISLLSIAGNIVLMKRSIDRYRRERLLRLDPTEIRLGDDGAFSSSTNDSRRTLVYIGDSHIKRWTTLPKIPGDLHVLRLGVAGQTTSQVLLRLRYYMSISSIDMVVIHAGINDLMDVGIFPERQQQIGEHCYRNLEAIIDTVTQSGAHAVVLTIFPIGEPSLLRQPFWNDAILRLRKELNSRLLMRSYDCRVTVIDCDPILAIEGRLNSDYAEDTLHLKSAGYQALNTYVQPIIERLLLESRTERNAF